MPNYAVVQQSDGLVINIIVAGEGDSPPAGYSFIPAGHCSPGWVWDGQQFYDPNPPPEIEEEPPAEEVLSEEAPPEAPVEGEPDGA